MRCDTKSRNKLPKKAALSIWGNPTTACVAGNGGVGSLWDNVGKLRAYTLPPELSYFIDQLAEEIVLSETIPTCRLCSIGECQSQVGGLVCRNAVKAWLLERAKRYLCPKAEAKTGDKRE